MKSEIDVVIALADRGFSYKCISRYTGFQKSHIGYILKKHKTKVSNYRNGENEYGKNVIKRLRIR